MKLSLVTRRFLTLIASGLILVFVNTPESAFGQTTYGSIVGSVTDAGGGTVPGAALTLTNLGTNERRVFTSSEDGSYQFINLPALVCRSRRSDWRLRQ